MTTPTETPRRRDPTEKLEKLIASGIELFGREGYVRAQIAAICHEAGVSIGTFYDNFEDKAELLLHLAEVEHYRSDPPPTHSLAELEQQMRELLSSPRSGLSVAWLEAVRVEPKLLVAHEEMRSRNLERYAAWVRDTRKALQVTSALDEHSTARAVVALLKDGFGSPEPVEDSARFLARSIWALVTSH